MALFFLFFTWMCVFIIYRVKCWIGCPSGTRMLRNLNKCIKYTTHLKGSTLITLQNFFKQLQRSTRGTQRTHTQTHTHTPSKHLPQVLKTMTWQPHGDQQWCSQLLVPNQPWRSKVRGNGEWAARSLSAGKCLASADKSFFHGQTLRYAVGTG